MSDDYQSRTPERLVGILRSSDQNPRSWQQEAADTIEYQAREIQRLEDAIATWRKHAHEVGRLLTEALGQGAGE